MNHTVQLVVPQAVDDPRRPSGGNTYDRRIAEALAARGRAVRRHRVAGAWPRPTQADLARLGTMIDRLPGGDPVVLDGLIAAAARDVLAPRARAVPLVVLVHMPWGPVEPACAGEGDVLAAARAVVTTSAWTRNHLLQAYGLPAERVHTIRPGVDPAPAAPPSPGGGRLVCVAAVTAAKGYDLLVEALRRLPPDGPGWSCRCVGATDLDVGFSDRLRATAVGAGLTDRVTFVGALTGAALDRVYATSDLLVLPSRRESFGMVITEALARAVPVIAADVGGVREALDGHGPAERPGILVPPDDASALADALHVWLTDEGARSRLRSSAARRRTTLPGWEAAAATLDGILSEVTPATATSTGLHDHGGVGISRRRRRGGGGTR